MIEVLNGPSIEYEGLCKRAILTKSFSQNLSVGEELERKIKTVSILEKYNLFQLTNIHRVVLPTASGLISPDELMMEPGSKFHIIPIMANAQIEPGEYSLSSGFGLCQAIAIQVEDSLHFRHNFVYDMQSPANFSRQINKDHTIGIITLIAKKEEHLQQLMEQILKATKRKKFHFVIGKVEPLDDSFRVWTHMDRNGNTAIRVTSDDEENTIVSVEFNEI